ncbi:MAG: sulfur carrier protein ThiS adenylyltransferase ThiF [Sporomusaceae bacterium]|nr:sulfur carrier protein ThiS adenylyltransferase ThiF [Sporomusaceae bacterium]
MNAFETSLANMIGCEALTKIQSFKIGIAGAGGLGSNCAVHLVRSGFIDFTIADFDVLEPSNLNRQYYFSRQIGSLKVEMLRKNLTAINPAAQIHTVAQKLDTDDFSRVFADCHVVIEAFDKAEYKKKVIEALLSSDKLLVGASGLAGMGDSDAITIHQIKERFFLIGDLVTGVGVDQPPLAPRVAVAAAKQADVVLRYALGMI